MKGTRVWALVQEDPTCGGATKPERHNVSLRSRAREPQLLSLHATTTEAHEPQLLKPVRLEPTPQQEATAMRNPHTTTKSNPHSPQLEKARVQQQRPNAARNSK